jgi:GNAT superfamily N-acetyltransferase
MVRLRRPPGYPRELERDITLTDGRRLHVRPVVPGDAKELLHAIQTADADTLRARFLGGRPPTDVDSLRHLVELDYRTRLALAAFDHGVGVAIARYEGAEGSDVAEVAVAVQVGWRHAGLATQLVRLLAEAALARGITKFTATYFATNVDVHDLVAESGMPHLPERDHGVVEEVIALNADETLEAADREEGLGNGHGVPAQREESQSQSESESESESAAP